jgi:hypothetical protein
LGIGLFLNALVSFTLTMFAVFLFVRMANKVRGQKITTRQCPYCKMDKVSVEATICPYCCSKLTPQKPQIVKPALTELEKLEEFGKRFGNKIMHKNKALKK